MIEALRASHARPPKLAKVLAESTFMQACHFPPLKPFVSNRRESLSAGKAAAAGRSAREDPGPDESCQGAEDAN